VELKAKQLLQLHIRTSNNTDVWMARNPYLSKLRRDGQTDRQICYINIAFTPGQVSPVTCPQ